MSTSAPTKPKGDQEDLPRMSFGDHLDELRRRLMISLIAVFVCVGGVLPFKGEVTDIYISPYRQMWLAAFEDHIADWSMRGIPEDQRETAAPWSGVEDLEGTEQEVAIWLRDHHVECIEPDYEFHAMIESRGAFQLPYSLKAIGGLDDVWIFMAATLLFGLILATPVVLYQAWSFIGAGLYKHERSVIMKYLPFALGLSTAGILFGYFLVVPMGLFFLARMMDWTNVVMLLSVTKYFSFLLTLTAALGVVFQLPLMMLALQKVGLVSHTAMRKNWRYVILGMFALSAILTPPDPFTQILMACPMVVLFCLGLFLTWRSERRSATNGSLA